MIIYFITLFIAKKYQHYRPRVTVCLSYSDEIQIFINVFIDFFTYIQRYCFFHYCIVVDCILLVEKAVFIYTFLLSEQN